jgi:photosystem II stability/assembly factor-like uncharacterized protein
VNWLALALLAQEVIPLPTQQSPVAPAPEGPVVYEASKGPILLPNKCAEVDLDALGLTCSEGEPCETFLEFSGTEQNNDVFLLTGNLHTSTATLQSLLLVSEDAGASWREGHPRLKGASLEGMQFIDFSNGWVAGHTSLALPRDPFLLLTTDGGRTWRRTDFYAESRVGLVEDFAFKTAKQGWALIDNKGSGEAGRYELFETQTGGTSWELREISNKVPKTAAPGQRLPSATMRTRADAKKNTIVLERRVNNTWTPVVSFRLKLEDCKPVPPAD